MTGLRKFNKTVDKMSVLLVGRKAARLMKKEAQRMFGIKRRGPGKAKKNAKQKG